MLILASKSPRRKQLLEENINSSFLIIPSSYEEELDINKTPLENVCRLAYKKGETVFTEHPDDIVLSCDTIVTLNNKIYGKPKDKKEAYVFLKELSNKTHEVITAYSIFYKGNVINNHVISKVTFNCLSDDLITSYIATGSPFDKAGGYGIQDPLGKLLVKEYKGSLSNIIGMPIEEIKKDLEGLKY